MRILRPRVLPEERRALERTLEAALSAAPLPETRAVAIRRALATAEPRRPRRRGWAVPIAAALLAMPAAALWRSAQAPRLVDAPPGALPSGFERMALALHERGVSASGATLVTANASLARAWGRSRTGVDVSLPAVRPREDEGRFVLGGVEAVDHRGAMALAVWYSVDGSPVTLAAARDSDVPDGAPAWTIAGKTIRVRAAGGHRLLSWTSSGQSYVLVSDPPASGLRACLVCHTQPARREVIGRLAR